MPVTHTIAYYDAELMIEKKIYSTGQEEPFTEIHCKLSSLPVTKTLAYYDTELITAVKGFIVQAKRSPLRSLILWVK
jgi:hypothetical protein